MTIPADATLEEIATGLAPLIAANAAFDGWGAAARDAAADAGGVDRDVALLACSGPVEMIAAWFGSIDQAMVERVPAGAAATMKIRARITALVEARLAIVEPNREALRRAFAILALPQNLSTGAKLGWGAADAIWRAAGDTATDYNHYSKRLTLGTIYAATMTVFLDDESEGWVDTRAFLARRIEGIMRFEKTKAGILARAAYRPSLSRFIGRLRYPAV